MINIIDTAITVTCMALLVKSIQGVNTNVTVRTYILEILSIIVYGIILLGGLFSLPSKLKEKGYYRFIIWAITIGTFLLTWFIFQYLR